MKPFKNIAKLTGQMKSVGFSEDIIKLIDSKLDIKKPTKGWGITNMIDYISCFSPILSNKEIEHLQHFVGDEMITGFKLYNDKMYKRNYLRWYREIYSSYFEDFDEKRTHLEKKHALVKNLGKFLYYILQALRNHSKIEKQWILSFCRLIKSKKFLITMKGKLINNYVHISKLADLLYNYDVFYLTYFEFYVKTIYFLTEYKKYTSSVNGPSNLSKIESLKNEVDKFFKRYERVTKEYVKSCFDYYLILYPERILPDEYKLNDEEKKRVFGEVSKKYKIDEDFFVKLVITDIYSHYDKDYDDRDLARRQFSPILQLVPFVKKEFGMFHIAVSVGPFFLSWDNSSLIIPKNIKSSKGIAVIDLGNHLKYDILKDQKKLDHKKIGKVVKTVAKTSWEYNNKHVYSNIKDNCQGFACLIFKQILKKDFKKTLNSPVFKPLMEGLKAGEGKTVSFFPSKEFLDKYSYAFDGENCKKFDILQHSKFDDWVNNLGGFKVFINEAAFLKAIDRAFWLRLLRYKDDESFYPSMEGGEVFNPMLIQTTACPFSNPLLTGTFNLN